MGKLFLMKRVEGKMAELLVWFFGLVLIIFYGMYTIHVYLPKNTKWKYIFSMLIHFRSSRLVNCVAGIRLAGNRDSQHRLVNVIVMFFFTSVLYRSDYEKQKEFVFGRRKVNGTY